MNTAAKVNRQGIFASALIITLSSIMLLNVMSEAAAPPSTLAHKSQIMQASVRVNKRLTGPSSGVIICAQNHDENTRLWVLSTGHMYDRAAPEIEIFYKNDRRLNKPIFVKGQISLLVENNSQKGIDFCVICADVEGTGFSHVPLAPANFKVKKDEKLLAVGCDLGIEPKCFEMKMMNYREKRGDFYVAGESKVGRSGGGIFTADGKYLVGICWGGYADAPKSMYTNHKVILDLIEKTGVIK